MNFKRVRANIEIIICFFVWMLTVFISLYSLYEFSKNIDTEILSENVSPGWYSLGRLKDTSDYEWNYWKSFAISLLPWLFIHGSVAELLRQNKCSYLHLWYCTISSIFIAYNFGSVTLLIMLSQPVIYWCVLICRGTIGSIWICSFVCLLMINIMKNLYDMNSYHFLMLTKFNNEKFYMVLVALSWIQLRCISVSLESIADTKNDQNYRSVRFRISIHKYRIIHMLSYSLYLPLLFLGPLILYKDFQKSFNVPTSPFKRRLFNLIANLSRYLTWLSFIEFCLHFVYFNALQYDLKIIEMMPGWCFYGGGLWMGLYFYFKYLITYGFTGSLTAFDDIAPETPPRCILRVHLYSQMWKYFDVGLHKFLLRYIYKPILSQLDEEDVNKKDSVFLLAVKCLASLLCFIFVFLWHGLQYFIFLWSMLNYLGIVLESIAKTISETKTCKRLTSKIFHTKLAMQRFYAALCTPVLMVSALSNFYFFGGMEVGDAFVIRFLNQSAESFALMCFCLYCSCRVSQYCARFNARSIKMY
ncbi:protein-cysteine N-palmitoyltransferase Rasp [Arctopsyche grandis]|uniref:protein-cysteine N-palmitoyltransferase Rasp n=1 Tax=Arctopsyche grandis TaxID=121162 RepID=UPI00406D96C1